MAGELLEAFRDTARANPDARAITFIGERSDSYTFGELLAHSDRLAERLAAHRLPLSAPLGILLRSQEDQVLHYLAALAAGHVPAILTPPNPKLNRAYYAETMAGVLARCSFSALITDLDDLTLPCPGIRPYDLDQVGDMRQLEASGEPLEAAFLQFSSGTTGVKRGVLVTDDAVLAQLRTYGAAIGLDSTDVIVSWLPLYHDMGFIACLNMPLAWGVHTVMIDPIAWVTRPSSLLRAASDHRATLSWNPNFAYAFMAQRSPATDIVGVDLSSVRGLANCSEPVTQASQTLFLERFGDHGIADDVFWGCYAMAETTFAITHGTPADGGYLDTSGPEDATLGRPVQVSVGRPLPDVDLRIVAEDGSALPERSLGELQVRSPFTFSRYFNDNVATAAAFDGDWYRTGDMGYCVGDQFYVMDRKKDVMIVSGVNVFPRDVEELVSSVTGVIPGRVSAFSSFDQRVQTERVVVLFESLSGEASVGRVVVEIRQRILAAFQIANFEVHPLPAGWLVKSSAGKIARSANRAKWLAGLSGGQVAKDRSSEPVLSTRADTLGGESAVP